MLLAGPTSLSVDFKSPVSYDLTLAVWPLTVIVPVLYPIFIMQEDEMRTFVSRMI